MKKGQQLITVLLARQVRTGRKTRMEWEVGKLVVVRGWVQTANLRRGKNLTRMPRWQYGLQKVRGVARV